MLSVVAGLTVGCLVLRAAVRVAHAQLSDAIDEWSPRALTAVGSCGYNVVGDSSSLGRDAMALQMRALERESHSDDVAPAGAGAQSIWPSEAALLCRLAWMSVRIVVAFCQVSLCVSPTPWQHPRLGPCTATLL